MSKKNLLRPSTLEVKTTTLGRNVAIVSTICTARPTLDLHKENPEKQSSAKPLRKPSFLLSYSFQHDKPLARKADNTLTYA